jgi:hypothetical protein
MPGALAKRVCREAKVQGMGLRNGRYCRVTTLRLRLGSRAISLHRGINL